MIEHRLIEKMLGVVDKELQNIRINRTIDPVFIDTVVDFIRTYADRTHHGKEEDILFKELEKKKLSDTDFKSMQDLIEEHIFARKTVKELVDAKMKYIDGDSKSIDEIIAKLEFLINFYPEHIRKEDEVFFPEIEKYFSFEELEKMLEEFRSFDQKMIHEKYSKLYESLSGKQ